MAPGEIHLANFPFGDAPGMKLRPVYLLTGPLGRVPEVLVAYISSVVPPYLLPTDLLLDPSQLDFASTQLRIRSVLRLHKLATIHCTSVARRLGTLSQGPRALVDDRLRAMLCL